MDSEYDLIEKSLNETFKSKGNNFHFLFLENRLVFHRNTADYFILFLGFLMCVITLSLTDVSLLFETSSTVTSEVSHSSANTTKGVSKLADSLDGFLKTTLKLIVILAIMVFLLTLVHIYNLIAIKNLETTKWLNFIEPNLKEDFKMSLTEKEKAFFELIFAENWFFEEEYCTVNIVKKLIKENFFINVPDANKKLKLTEEKIKQKSEKSYQKYLVYKKQNQCLFK